MQITVSLERATQLRPNLWVAILAPAQAIEVGPPLARRGAVTVIQVSNAAHNAETGRLDFPLSSVSVLNLGQFDEALILADGAPVRATRQESPASISEQREREDSMLKPGDSECLRSLSALPKDIYHIGQKVVERIRQLDKNGDLRLEGKRYINRIDNFITIQPQFRLGDLLVTVRGAVKVDLPIAAAIPGYSAFKINRHDQLAQALKLVDEAKRRT